MSPQSTRAPKVSYAPCKTPKGWMMAQYPSLVFTSRQKAQDYKWRNPIQEVSIEIMSGSIFLDGDDIIDKEEFAVPPPTPAEER